MRPACELSARLAALFPDIAPRAILIDHNRTSARTWAHRRAQGSKPRCRRTRCRPGSGSVSQRLVETTLSTGETLDASTVVWCAGMRANPLTADLAVERDRLGRVAVDGLAINPFAKDIFRMPRALGTAGAPAQRLTPRPYLTRYSSSVGRGFEPRPPHLKRPFRDFTGRPNQSVALFGAQQ